MPDFTIENADQLGPRELVDAVLEEQRRRFAAGERPNAEEYLGRFAAIVADPSLAVDVIYSEFLLRREHGDAVRPAEYLDQYPQYADLLERQFAVHEALQSEPDSPDDADATMLHDPQRITAARADDDTAGNGIPEIPADIRWHGFPILGNYRVEAQIGRGGMGAVFRAVHQAMKRPVALKLLPAEQMKRQQAVSRFRREMEVVGRLDHPNIVRATDAGEIQGVHYLAMELVEGIDLAMLCRRAGLGPRGDAGAPHEGLSGPSETGSARCETTPEGPPASRPHHRVSVADVCELIRQAATGLAHAHEQGLVHRDVKPSNLMLSKEGQVKVLDLGLALLSEHGSREQRELTSTEQLMGTFDYMAPEQASDSHEVDHRADVYSLGATMFHLLAGRPPFADEKRDTPLKLLAALATQEAPSIAERRGDLPGALVAIVDRMLARDPSARFESAEQVAEALAPFAEGSDLAAVYAAATDESGWSAAAAVELAERDDRRAQARTPEGKARPRRRRRVATLVAAAGALLLGAVVFAVTDKGTFEIRSDVDDVQVVLSKGGEEFAVVDLRTDSKVRRLPSGEYEVSLKGRSGLELDKDGFTLKRWGTEAVTVTRIEPESAFDVPTTTAPASDVPATTTPAPRRVAQLELVRTLEGHESRVVAIDISPDGRLAVSGSHDTTARLWDVQTGDCLHTFDFQANANCVDISPDGQYVAVGGTHGSRLRIWDLETHALYRDLSGDESYIDYLSFSPDSQSLLAISTDGTVRYWELETAKTVHSFPLDAQREHDDTMIAGDGRLGVVCPIPQAPSIVCVLDLQAGRLSRWLEFAEGCEVTGRGAISNDASTLLVTLSKPEFGNVAVYDLAKGVTNRTFGKGVHDVVFLPDDRHAVCGKDTEVTVWDTLTGEQVARSIKHKYPVPELAVSPDGSTILAGHSNWPPYPSPDPETLKEDFAIRVWRLPKGVWSKPEPAVAGEHELTH